MDHGVFEDALLLQSSVSVQCFSVMFCSSDFDFVACGDCILHALAVGLSRNIFPKYLERDAIIAVLCHRVGSEKTGTNLILSSLGRW
jgi:hypothetical protein